MRKMKIAIAMAMIVVFTLPAMVSAFGSSIIPNRSEVMWTTGYDGNDDRFSLNPLGQGPSWGTQLMYEYLFGFNAKTQTVVPWIGNDYVWAADGSYVTIRLNPNAKWSNGSAITAYDVKFSYMLVTEFRYTDFNTRVTSIDVINATALKFNLAASYYYSALVDMWLTLDIAIVPSQQWKVYNDTYNTGAGLTYAVFRNNWFNETEVTPANRVYSGCYEPYYKSDNDVTWIWKKNANWWGANQPMMAALPQNKDFAKSPLYVGWIKEGNNNVKNGYLLTSLIDWHTGFYKDIDSAMAVIPSIKHYYGNTTKGNGPQVVALSAPLGIYPNHERYPFNQPWLRELLWVCMEPDYINELATGMYWENGTVNLLNKNNALHAPYFNQTIADTYKVNYNMTRVAEILAQYCYVVDEGGKDVYYTNGAGAGSATAGMLGPGGDPIVDEDGVAAGINIKLGGLTTPWSIITPQGWTDPEVSTTEWAKTLTKVLNTTVQAGIILQSNWETALKDGDFDLCMYCCGSAAVLDVINYFQNWITRENEVTSCWAGNNITRWTGALAAEFIECFDSLETTKVGNPAMFMSNVSRMQEILAIEKPFINNYYNGLWIFYNEYYFKNFPMKALEWQDILAASTTNKPVLKTRIVLNLEATGVGPATPTVPWGGLEIAGLVGLVGMVAITLKKRKVD